jgi:rod shape-determining protein MreC
VVRGRSTYRILGIVILGALLVFANSRGWLKPVKDAAGSVVNPVSGVFVAAGQSTGNFFHLLFAVKQIAADNTKLTDQVAELRQRLSEDAEMRRENEELRAQFNLPDSAKRTLLPANVVSYQPDNVRQYMTINRGSKDGLRDGLAVISGGSLVGKLSDVTRTSAKVFLVTDPSFKVSAIDQDSTNRAAGTVTGHLGSGLIMDKIAQTDGVKQGDTVITSGLGGELPKGILIGQVQGVYQQDNAVFQSAQLISDVKFNRLEMVFVVTGP